MGYTEKPVWQKLEFKTGLKILVINPPADYKQIISGHPDVEIINTESNDKVDMLHIFSYNKADLESIFAKYQMRVDTGGIIWISWPKKQSKVATDISEQDIRDVILPDGWVDTKVCAVSEIWSGLKLQRRRISDF